MRLEMRFRYLDRRRNIILILICIFHKPVYSLLYFVYFLLTVQVTRCICIRSCEKLMHVVKISCITEEDI